LSLARSHRAAADPRSAACALAFGSIVVLGFLDGGYYASTWRWASLALAAVAGIQLLLRRAATPSPLALLSVTALAALAGWMLLSALWGIAGTEAQREAERCATHVAALVALLSIARPATARALLTGTLGGIVTLAGFALGVRILGSPELDPYQGSLLKEPVGYANTLGILTAIGLVLAVGLASETRSRVERGGYAVAGSVTVAALALTSSRGAWLAALVGLGVLALARVRSRRVAALLVVAGAASVLLALSTAPLGDRPAYWRVAASDVSEHPLLGSGAGSFDDYWLEHRPIPADVRDAHSLYLETVAELGIVGLALLLCALGTPLVAAVRARAQGVLASAAAGYAAFLVHAGLDWDWEMPVTVVAGLACGAAILVAPRRT
jgi:O-antigen ligase